MRRRGACSLRSLAALPSLLLAACAPTLGAPAAPRQPIPHAPAGAAVGATATLLAAHAGEPTLPDLDARQAIFAVVYVVFSAALDPASVTEERFLVALDDGRRVVPARATLVSSRAPHEQRAVVLALARPKGGKAPRPLSVSVIGALYTSSGAPLEGSSGEIEAAEAAARLLAARLLSAPPPGCAAAEQGLRTYWTLPMARAAGVDGEIAVSLAGGGLAPARVVDLSEESGDGLRAAAHVVDLCVGSSAGEAARLVIGGGALADIYGRPSAAADAAISRARGE
jgi:hypothetical protein